MIAQGDIDHTGVIAGGIAGWAVTNYDAALLQLRLYRALGNATAWRQAAARAQSLACEREIPPELLVHPNQKSSEPRLRETAEAAFAATSAPEGINEP